MEIRYSCSPRDFKRYTTEETRREFLIEKLFEPNEVIAVYSHVDRMVTLGVMPVNEKVPLDKGIDVWHTFGTQFFRKVVAGASYSAAAGDDRKAVAGA